MISVLLVDDDEPILDLTKVFLEEEKDIKVTTNTSAFDALTLMESTTFHAIVADYEMPLMNGIEFLKTLKSQGNDTPFIIFTGRGREYVAIEALNNGATFYLQKGTDVATQYAELRNMIHQAVQRKQSEQALLTSEERYRAVVESQMELICRFRPDGTYLFANGAFCRYYSRTIDELVGHRFIPRVLTEDQQLISHHFSSLTIENPTGTMEHRITSSEGKIRWQQWSDTAIFDERGVVIEYQSVGRDITEKKLTEEALHESRIRLNAIVQGSPIPQFVIDSNHRVIYWNAALEELSGIKAEKMIGTNRQWKAFYRQERPCMADLLADTELDKIPQLYKGKYAKSKLIDGGYEATDFFPHMGLSGKWLYFTAAPIRNSQGAIIGAVETLEDITERKQTEKLYQTVFENTGTAMMIIEEDTTISHINEGMEKIWGYSREEIEGRMKWPKLVAAEDLERMLEYHRHRRTNPESVPGNYEFRYIHKNGELRDASLTAAMIPGTKKSVISLRDITELKKTEKALVKSEGIFRQLEGQLPDYVIIHEGETIVFVNAEGARLMGRRPEQIIGTSVLSYAAPEFHDLIRKNILLRYQGVMVPPYEIGIFAPSGDRRWVVVRATPILNRDKPATLTVLTDITERKRAEEALRESEERYRTIIETAQEGIWTLDRNFQISYINEKMAGMLGYTQDEMLKKSFAEFLPEDELPHANRQVELRRKGIRETYERRFLHRNGEIRTMLTSSASIYDPDGTFSGSFAMFTDITERKKAEEALRQANRKLHLLSGITRHDISNQLLALDGFLVLLQMKVADPALEDHFTRITNASARISAMIRFTKEYEEIGITAPAWQDIRTIVNTAATQVPLGQVMLKNDLPAGTEMFADPLIVKVFFNLTDNAVRYGRKITTIRFSVEDRNGVHIIVCEDDGDGIAPEEKEKIFWWGFGKNTGLGLALSSEILNITGIAIRENGVPGAGARFEITVPAGAYRFNAAQ